MPRIFLLAACSLCFSVAGFSQSWIRQETPTRANLLSACFAYDRIGFLTGGMAPF